MKPLTTSDDVSKLFSVSDLRDFVSVRNARRARREWSALQQINLRRMGVSASPDVRVKDAASAPLAPTTAPRTPATGWRLIGSVAG